MSTTSNYTVLARRYRPQTFEDVIGQNHVATALRNAIKAGRVAHAYLFTGARGVGKTSLARILAKALNCPNTHDGVPCNQCDICEGVTSGQDIDIQEIDGASNRSIDDIRSLRANVGVKSMRTKYKMYIIDEVHMLTKEAFNALLKTLEEPPPNVKFVFCTTEPHKVPDTILSRCQRFDFSSIDMTNIVMRLTEIAEKEGMAVSPEAVELVARRAGGSMRDSQSLFDQLLAFGSENITAEDVNRLLGTAGDDRLCLILESTFHRQAAESLRMLSQSLAGGVQVTNLCDQLIFCMRDMMVMAVGADDVPLLGIGEVSRPRLKTLASQIGVMTINCALQILAEVKSKMSRVVSPRPLLELGLVRITLLEDLSALRDVIQQLRQNPGQPAVIHQNVTNTIQQVSHSAEPLMTNPTALSSAPLSASQHTSAPAKTSQQGIPPAQHATENPPQKKTELVSSPQISKPVPDDQHASKVESRHQNLLPEDPPRKIWERLIKIQDDVTQTYMGHAESLHLVNPGILEVIFPARYNFSKITLEKKQELIVSLEVEWKRLTGGHRKFRLKSSHEVQSSESQVQESTKPGRHQQSMQQVENDPFLKKVEEIFQANLIKVDKILPE